MFVHSGWRTGSTYVWNKFRRHSACLAFYEPFNDLLGTISPVGVLLISRHDADLRHPTLDWPYFHEYLPLLGDKGHPLFREAFVCRDYFAADGARSDQRAYLDSLLALAGKARKTAVLGLVRSLGRVGWFKRELAGVNIVLIRSPFSQWVSGQRLATERGYGFFDPTHFLILSQAQDSAPTVEHAHHHGIPRQERLPYGAARLALADIVRRAPPAHRFAVFASVYFLSYMAALPYADLVVDMDRLSSDVSYREDARARVAALTGCDIDFADVLTPRYGRPDAPPEVADALAEAAAAIAAARGPLWDDRSCGDPAGAESARAIIAAKFADDCALLAGGG